MLRFHNGPTSHGECQGCDVGGVPVRIIWQCGHAVCTSCGIHSYCPVPGCSGTGLGFEHVLATEFDVRAPKASIYGQKIEELIQLIRNIEMNKERVLLFIQDQNVIKKVELAFKRYNITFRRLIITGSAKVLTDFKKSTDTVLILNIGISSAAGANSTCANHVIFLAPYLTRGSAAKAKYQSAMEQAIGRARRYGQKKEVHVYHFLYQHTFDVDLFEEMRVCTLVPETNGFGEETRDGWSDDTYKTHYSSHLSHLVLGRNEL